MYIGTLLGLLTSCRWPHEGGFSVPLAHVLATSVCFITTGNGQILNEFDGIAHVTIN